MSSLGISEAEFDRVLRANVDSRINAALNVTAGVSTDDLLAMPARYLVTLEMQQDTQLAALENLLRHYATGHEDNPEIKQARAALAMVKAGRDVH